MNNYSEGQLSEFYKTLIEPAVGFVIKGGTSVVTDLRTGLPNMGKIEDIVAQAAYLRRMGKKVTIVTSGAIGAGRGAALVGQEHIDDLADRQAFASMGQVKLIRLYDECFGRHGLHAAQFLASHYDMADTTHVQNFLNTIARLAKYNGLAVVNENDPFSTEEIQTENGGTRGTITFGDNDKLSIMVAKTLSASVLFYLSDEPGLMDYAAGNKVHVVDDLHDARKFVSDKKSKGGTGGMSARLNAIEEAIGSRIAVVMVRGMEDNVVLRVLEGEPLGTLFLPKNFIYRKGGE